jgi:predicted PurR-regulated permease PerM
MEQEVLLRKIRRQLRWLNVVLSFFGILILVGFIISGILLYKLVTFTHNAESKIDNLQSKATQSLDVQKQACDNSELSTLLKSANISC